MGSGAKAPQPDDGTLLTFFRAIAAGDLERVARMLDSSPTIARDPIRVAASRADAPNYFLEDICHYVYGGDTGLHLAAAAHQRATAEKLCALGADARARNRRGAEPLHYAADGGPTSPSWNPAGQYEVIEYLISIGADPNALDKSGVAPLHRAVRGRCTAAVRALLDHGADALLKNKRGSTPLHLAVQNTGASASGADEAKAQQGHIIALLRQHGAGPADTDAKGKTVESAATSEWIRGLLTGASS
jgi:ankyrin repeat protein